MPVFRVRTLVPGMEPDTRPIIETFYVIANTRQGVVEAVREREGVEGVTIEHELTEEEARAFRYLRSAEF